MVSYNIDTVTVLKVSNKLYLSQLWRFCPFDLFQENLEYVVIKNSLPLFT